MKIATVATGGIGGFLAVKLGLRGHQIATIARGAHLEAISTHGLALKSPTGDLTMHPWIATSDPSIVGEVDAILFGVKGDDLEAAARTCLPMLGPIRLLYRFLTVSKHLIASPKSFLSKMSPMAWRRFQRPFPHQG